jgi:hypothetical protein
MANCRQLASLVGTEPRIPLEAAPLELAGLAYRGRDMRRQLLDLALSLEGLAEEYRASKGAARSLADRLECRQSYLVVLLGTELWECGQAFAWIASLVHRAIEQ